MNPLRKTILSAVMFSSAFTALIGRSLGEDCGFLLDANSAPLALSDRQLYYQLPGRSGWTKMEDAGLESQALNIRLTYVIVDNFSEPRGGVLVIKSGRIRQLVTSSDEQPSSRVRLVRLPDKFDNVACANVTEFGEKDISAKSYDSYHDQGLNVPELKTIKAFHFQYASRRNNCKMTNDNTADSAFDLRSNLSQFSFDKRIVARGSPRQIVQILGWLGIAPAYASSTKLSDERVEMKQYRTNPGKPICVRFTLAVPKPASFLRINDLEGLSQSGLNYIRAGEQEWPLSH